MGQTMEFVGSICEMQVRCPGGKGRSRSPTGMTNKKTKAIRVLR